MCLPLNLGAIYNHLVETDLILAFDVVLGGLYFLWFINSKGFSKPKLIWGKVTPPFVLLFAWTCLSAINAISLTMVGLGLYMIIKSYLVYLYIVNNVRTKSQLNRMVMWLLIGISFQGFLGIVQYTTGSSLGLEFLGAHVNKRMSGVTRVRGTIGMPNQFGAWLALIIPIAVSLFIFEEKGRRKLYLGGATFLGILGLLMSFSRSAWAGLLGSGGVFIIILLTKRMMKPKYFLTIGVALVVVVGMVIGFWDTILMRFDTGSTGKYRWIMIDIAIDIIKDNFLVGVGLHNYNFHQIEIFRFWNPVHNTYLRLAAETGIPGLMFFLIIIFMSLKESYSMLKCKDRQIFALALGCFCSLWAFLFTVNFGPEYGHYRIKFLFWFVIGVIMSLRRVYNLNLKKMRQRQRALSARPGNGKQIPAPIASVQRTAGAP